MHTALIITIIIIAEALWSYLAGKSTVHTVTKKRWRATLYSASSLTVSYAVLAVIAKNDWNVWMIAASVLGVSVGTYLVASRRPKKKRRVIKRMQGVTTA